jgi:hypothetical protein
MALHLREPGNSGANREAKEIPGDMTFEVIVQRRGMRARAHKRHFPAQDVQKLWQFIDARAPQDATHARNARVVHLALHYLISIFHGTHGAQLQDRKLFPVESITALADERLPGRFQFDEQSRSQKNRRCRKKQKRREHSIEATPKTRVPNSLESLGLLGRKRLLRTERGVNAKQCAEKSSFLTKRKVKNLTPCVNPLERAAVANGVNLSKRLS